MTGPVYFDEEEEANYFAMCLLIPEDLLRADIARSGKLAFDLVDEPLIGQLANRYQVTPQLMLLRLIDLGYFKVKG